MFVFRLTPPPLTQKYHKNNKINKQTKQTTTRSKDFSREYQVREDLKKRFSALSRKNRLSPRDFHKRPSLQHFVFTCHLLSCTAVHSLRFGKSWIEIMAPRNRKLLRRNIKHSTFFYHTKHFIPKCNCSYISAQQGTRNALVGMSQFQFIASMLSPGGSVSALF